MAYRIRYKALLPGNRKKHAPLAFQGLCAVVLLCLILLGNHFSDQWEIAAREVFVPSQELSCFRGYAQGQSIRQMLAEQCRAVLIEAGYEG